MYYHLYDEKTAEMYSNISLNEIQSIGAAKKPFKLPRQPINAKFAGLDGIGQEIIRKASQLGGDGNYEAFFIGECASFEEPENPQLSR